MAYRRSRTVRRRFKGRRRTSRRRSRRPMRRRRISRRGKRGMVRIPRIIPKLMRPEFKYLQWEEIHGPAPSPIFRDVTKLITRGSDYNEFVGNRLHAVRLDMRIWWIPYEDSYEDLTHDHTYLQNRHQYGFWWALVRQTQLHTASAPSTVVAILASLYDLPTNNRGDPRYWFRNVDHNTNNQFTVIKKGIVQLPANAEMTLQQDIAIPSNDVFRPVRASWNYKKHIKINKTVVYERDNNLTPAAVRGALYFIMWPLDHDPTYNPGIPGILNLHGKFTYTDS